MLDLLPIVPFDLEVKTARRSSTILAIALTAVAPAPDVVLATYASTAWYQLQLEVVSNGLCRELHWGSTERCKVRFVRLSCWVCTMVFILYV